MTRTHNQVASDNKLLRIRPLTALTVIVLLASGLLFCRDLNDPQWTILIAAGGSLLLTYITYFIIIKFKLGDQLLFLIISLLFNLGLIMIFRLNPAEGKMQLIWLAIGIFVFFIAILLYKTISFWPKLFWLYFAASIALFIVTLLLGQSENGATNWIVIKSVHIQTSEINKLIYIFLLSSFFVQPERLDLKHLLPEQWQQIKPVALLCRLQPKHCMMAVTYVYVAFLAMQRELGTALLLIMIYIVFLYVLDKDWKFLLFNIILAVIGAALAVVCFDHIQVRISVWLDPLQDPDHTGYQILQSLFAIGAGGFFGTGLGQGQPYDIPAADTDFIFSSICEEMGIFGGIAVVLLYFLLVYRSMKICLQQQNSFRKNIALGLTIMIGFQSFIIIGGVIRLIPMTGITLPFISYGGSSLLISFATMGILQASSLMYDETDSAESQADLPENNKSTS